jgi:Ni2+-binding GTPase involved in maturation of urease and hydrogenase
VPADAVERQPTRHLRHAEGEDKPLKYSTIFNSADLALVTRIDLADVVECDRAALTRRWRQLLK